MRVSITFEETDFDTEEVVPSGCSYQFSREVDELNPYDMLEYLLEASRIGGFEWSKMSSMSKFNNTLYETEE